MNTTFMEMLKNRLENDNTELVERTTTEEIAGKSIEVYNVPVTKKDKDGNETTDLVQIRDKNAIMALSDFDLFAYASTVSTKACCLAMARIEKKTAESCGFKSVVDMIYSLHPEYSKTTLKMYRRVGKIFGDLQADGYLWKVGIPQLVTVNNLSVVLGLLKLDDTETITQDEIDKAFDKFYCDYIASDKIHLMLSQSKLKKEVSDLNNGIIEGKAKEVETKDEIETEGEGEKETITTTDEDGNEVKLENSKNLGYVPSKVDAYKEVLAEISDFYKENKNIVKAIATIIKEMGKDA